MIVGIFTENYLPQESRVALSIKFLKETLEENGHEVYIITRSHDDNKAVTFEDHIIRIPKRTFSYNPFSMLFLKTYKILKNIHFDIFHVHEEYGVSIFARRVADRLQIPLIYTYYSEFDNYQRNINSGLFGEAIKEKTTVLMLKNMVLRQAEIIVKSLTTKKLLKSSYDVSSYINLIPDAIDLSEYEEDENEAAITSFKKRFKINKKKVILYKGSLNQDSKISEVIDAFDIYLNRKKAEDTILLVLGEGGELEAIKHKASISSHPDNFLFLKSNEDHLPFYYKLADVILSLSSTSSQDEICAKAMASKVPLLVNKDSDSYWYIKDCINGFVFDSQEEFSKKLFTIFNMSSKEIDYILDAAYQMKEELFSKSMFYNKVIHTYEKALRTHF